jgi:deoxyribodipyrimidine photo-lyase
LFITNISYNLGLSKCQIDLSFILDKDKNMKKLVIFWNRSDFRLNDNPALYYAANKATETNSEFINLFVFDNHFFDNPIYSRRAKFLIKIMQEFNKVLPLTVLHGDITNEIQKLSTKYSITIYANADFDPYGRARDAKIVELSKANNFEFNLLNDKITINKQQFSGTGGLYSIFTPFKKSVMADFVNSKVLPAPKLTDINYSQDFQPFDYTQFQSLILPLSITVNGSIIDLSKLDQELDYDWYTTEAEVIKSFDNFLQSKYMNYDSDRNDMTIRNSMMSVALKWGMVSARFLKDKIIQVDSMPQNSTYISELIWREFYKYLLFNHPTLLDTEFLAKYRNKQELWVEDSVQLEYFKAWINGKTGYPVVDAAMHQIRQEGYMHNRARMIVGSILTKNLGVDWRLGQEYFRAMLLDLDEASNCGGWQWSASVGADPKPIRIFNPYLQEENYDKLEGFRNKYLPSGYNAKPIIEHKIARDLALDRYKKAKEE